MNYKLYLASIADILLLTFSFIIDGYLGTLGLIIGIVVGVITIIKLIHDIRIKKLERKKLELEIQKKKLDLYE